MENIAKNIKNLRKKQNLSQRELAELCGWHTNTRIANYESMGKGKREPTLRDITIIANALNVSPSSLAFDNFPVQGNYPKPQLSGLPILHTENIIDWPANKELIVKEQHFDFLSDKLNLGLNAFVYEIEDESMFNFVMYEGFRKGTKVIIDPDKKYALGKSCVLYKRKNFIKVRKIEEDEEGIILVPFNNNSVFKRIAFTDDIKILGVVVAHLDVLV